MLEDLTRIGWRRGDAGDALLEREWLIGNGLGGYATGTLAGVCTRRYHGLLVAALPMVGRTVMLTQVHDALRLPDGTTYRLGGEERSGGLELHGASQLVEFRLELGLPVWTYEVGGFTVEKRVVMTHRQNTVQVAYRLLAGPGPCRLELRPGLHFRRHDAPVSAALPPYRFSAEDGRYELEAVASDLPPLRLFFDGPQASFVLERERLAERVYRVERSRGYDAQGDLWSPGEFRVELAPDQPVVLVASTEPWNQAAALPPGVALASEQERRRRLLEQAPLVARSGPAAELVLAADAFVITPMGRMEDQARSRAEGDEPRTVIAGYHWFTDWGRDTMISLEGLTLTTGRVREAGSILRTFARHVRDGLIPNLFPEGNAEGLYHTADATLWMFHAMDRYLRASGDRRTLRRLLPQLEEIVRAHQRGTRFGIRIAEDGLLTQGEDGYQLTWMDAKCDGWVVTPRRGKAVELNALWYNALRVLEGWLREERGEAAARPIEEAAAQARAAFNARFWYERGQHLFDVVDGERGDDAAFRPNQLFALSLPNPVLDRARWRPVLEAVRAKLLTPVGLRSLSRDHPDYKPSYHGDLRTRDAAYHQGTVWSWLIGPFVDAWLAVHPEDRAGARELLQGLVAHLGDACIGSVSEVFDAEPPFTARGCVAQAWGVAELLRALVKTAEPDERRV
ncbi:MAG TPA: amylo-alpha-1,6-glucosidase [Anaeromyxobacteraceae bacterium]